MFAKLLAVAALAVSCVSADLTPADVQSAFQSAKIVPDVLDSFDPTAVLNVTFTNSGSSVADFSPGTNLTVQQVTFAPQVSIISNDTSLADKTFVLIMVDPDAPTPQNRSLSEVRHFISGSMTLSGSLASGATLTNTTPAVSDYITPGPPAGSDPHRYTLMLFVEPSDFTTATHSFVNASVAPLNFNVSTFAQEVGLGSPVAGTYFLTGPDTSSSASASSTSPGSASPTSTSPSSGFVNVPATWMSLSAVLASLAAMVF